MNALKKYQTVIVIAIVVIAAFFAYSYFFTGPAVPALTSSPVSGIANADEDLIALLSSLKTIKLDDRIFSDPAFQSLRDFSTALVPEPVGRANPFAPLGK